MEGGGGCHTEGGVFTRSHILKAPQQLAEQPPTLPELERALFWATIFLSSLSPSLGLS